MWVALLKLAGCSFSQVTMPCPKQAKTHVEQLHILRSRDLHIPDESFALHCLEHHNYYRLSAYRFPITIKGNPDQFIPGASFTTLWELYEFDRKLRQLVREALNRMEISIRSRWAYVMATAHGPQSFEDVRLFRNPQRHAECLKKLDEELARSDEMFVRHYRDKYQMRRPPIWVACEIMSFGTLSRLYADTGPDRLRKDVARTYKLFPETLKSFLEHAVHIRNLCAHHCRLWNRRFTVSMTVPSKQPMQILDSFHAAEVRRIYNTLTLLGHMMDVVSPGHTWTQRLLELIESTRFPVCAEMGFPPDWKQRSAWGKAV